MRGVVALFIAVFLFVNISVLYISARAEESVGNTLYVGGSGPGNYSSIQDAINASNTGDNLYVFRGIYISNITINKSISLIGEHRNNTIIEGSIEVFTDNVTLSNFTIKNGTGVNIIGYDFTGSNRYFYNNTIKNNIISNSSGPGISLKWVFDSDFTNNTIEKNREGIWLQYSGNNNIEDNYIVDNKEEGITVSFSWENTFYRNVIENNEYGFYFDFFGERNNVTQNTIKSNSKYGIYIFNYSNNYNNFYTNNFINDTINAYDECNNTWDNDSVGNYWDNYFGLDKNNDGIGDTVNLIPGGKNKDRYPLMMLYEGKIKTGKYYVDEGSLYRMLIIGMIVAILFCLPIGYIWYRKYYKIK
jgi:nitrous oxidase accessory protein